MTLFEQALVTGVGTGAIYALIAYGISLVWSVSGTLNFAHGDILMVSLFVSLVALFLGVPAPIAVVLAVVIGGALGVLLQKSVFYPLRSRTGSLSWILGVIVFGAILRSVGTIIFESRAYPSPVQIGGSGIVHMPGGAVFRMTYVWILLIAVAGALLLEALIRRTGWGRRVRAVAESRTTAELLGIDTEKVITGAFALAACVGTLAGLLAAPLTFVSVSLGWIFTVKGFTAAVLGGIGRTSGVLVGGLLLGVLEQMLALAESASSGAISHALGAGYRDALAFAVLIVVLLVKPRGLFGPRTERFEQV